MASPHQSQSRLVGAEEVAVELQPMRRLSDRRLGSSGEQGLAPTPIDTSASGSHHFAPEHTVVEIESSKAPSYDAIHPHHHHHHQQPHPHQNSHHQVHYQQGVEVLGSHGPSLQGEVDAALATHGQHQHEEPRRSSRKSAPHDALSESFSSIQPTLLDHGETKQHGDAHSGNSHDSPDGPPSYSADDDSVESEPVRLMKLSPMQKKFYFFFEKPTGFWARAFSFISYLFIFVSTVILCVESLPVLTGDNGESTLTRQIFPLEAFITFWWLVELLCRFYASPARWTFFTHPMNVIDLLSVLPFLLFIIDDAGARNAARTFRVLRILKFYKLSQSSVGIQLAVKSIRRSQDAIWMMFLFIGFFLLTSSTAMFWAERGTWSVDLHTWVRPDGVKSPFSSIPEGFYWSMTTLATVGYGDVVPITPWGKLIATLTMFVSILTIALPTSIIGSNFMAEYQIFQRTQLQRKIRKNREKQHLDDKQSTSTSPRKRSLPDARLLTEQNALMLQNIGEIQEKLNDINPPHYYQKYKELENKYAHAKQKIHHLEKEVQRWKRQWKEARKSPASPFGDVLSALGSDGGTTEQHHNRRTNTAQTSPTRFQTFLQAAMRRSRSADMHSKSQEEESPPSDGEAERSSVTGRVWGRVKDRLQGMRSSPSRDLEPAHPQELQPETTDMEVHPTATKSL